MPEPLILPARYADRLARPSADGGDICRDRASRPVGVAAILVLLALITSLIGAGFTYYVERHATAEPISAAYGEAAPEEVFGNRYASLKAAA